MIDNDNSAIFISLADSDWYKLICIYCLISPHGSIGQPAIFICVFSLSDSDTETSFCYGTKVLQFLHCQSLVDVCSKAKQNAVIMLSH